MAPLRHSEGILFVLDGIICFALLQTLRLHKFPRVFDWHGKGNVGSSGCARVGEQPDHFAGGIENRPAAVSLPGRIDAELNSVTCSADLGDPRITLGLGSEARYDSFGHRWFWYELRALALRACLIGLHNLNRA